MTYMPVTAVTRSTEKALPTSMPPIRRSFQATRRPLLLMNHSPCVGWRRRRQARRALVIAPDPKGCPNHGASCLARTHRRRQIVAIALISAAGGLAGYRNSARADRGMSVRCATQSRVCPARARVGRFGASPRSRRRGDARSETHRARPSARPRPSRGRADDTPGADSGRHLGSAR